MNRQIKFRAWESYGSKWVYSDDFENMSDFWKEIECGNLDKNTLGQFTNLLDKNGKEIYEGDIVRWREFPKEVGEVKYDTDMFVVKLSDSESCHLSGAFNFGDYEVIGNVYENPELLK